MRWGMVAGIAVGCAAGLAVGVGAYTFVYAKGGSYFTNDPNACANCHIMQDHYDAWIKSSHRAVAVCNDCHTPPGVVAKYATKANNGFWHSFAFTTGDYPEPIRIKGYNRRIAQDACLKCHQQIVESIIGPHREESGTSCVRCHAGVGHPK